MNLNRPLWQLCWSYSYQYARSTQFAHSWRHFLSTGLIFVFVPHISLLSLDLNQRPILGLWTSCLLCVNLTLFSLARFPPHFSVIIQLPSTRSPNLTLPRSQNLRGPRIIINMFVLCCYCIHTSSSHLIFLLTHHRSYCLIVMQT